MKKTLSGNKGDLVENCMILPINNILRITPLPLRQHLQNLHMLHQDSCYIRLNTSLASAALEFLNLISRNCLESCKTTSYIWGKAGRLALRNVLMHKHCQSIKNITFLKFIIEFKTKFWLIIYLFITYRVEVFKHM